MTPACNVATMAAFDSCEPQGFGFIEEDLGVEGLGVKGLLRDLGFWGLGFRFRGVGFRGLELRV